jgi:ABC-type Fe3+-hydroxamate transport system substrate-binding protein
MKPEQRYIELGQTVLEEARRAVFLEAFGDALAQKEGLQNVNGIQAVHLYLMKKHHWHLSYIRTLSKDYLADLFKKCKVSI